MKTKKIIIAGGSGFLGNCLQRAFNQPEDSVIVLSRDHREDHGNVSYVRWDGKTLGAWAEVLENADVLINLSGKSVNCRYTYRNRQLIYESRIQSTRVLGQAIQHCHQGPAVWINAASATIYRHALDRPMDEVSGEYGHGFSVDVCKKWEQTFTQMQTPETRKVLLRTAIVLGRDGGALGPFRNLAHCGLGGPQGSGRQYVSWLHETDFVNIITFCLDNPGISGVYNAAAPEPVRNADFMRTLRTVHQIPFGLRLPEFLLEIGAAVILTETELVLKSRRVIPKRLLESGFRFQFADIASALTDLHETPRPEPRPLRKPVLWN